MCVDQPPFSQDSGQIIDEHPIAVEPQPLSTTPGCNLVDGSDVIFVSYASFLCMEICEHSINIPHVITMLKYAPLSLGHHDFNQGCPAQ